MNLNESATTFRGLPWFDLASNAVVTIGGAGGIGRYICISYF